MKNFKYLMTFESYSILGRVETVKITNEQGESVTCDAKIDTGSYSSRISADIAKKLKLPVIDQKKIKSVIGEENRVFVELQFKIAGIEIKTIAGIANMEGLRNEVAIGRKDIEMVDGIVDVKKNNKKPIGIPLNTSVEVEIEVEPLTEGIRDKMTPKSDEEIRKELDKLEGFEKLELITKYNNHRLYTDEEIRKEMDKFGDLQKIKLIKKWNYHRLYTDEEIKKLENSIGKVEITKDGRSYDVTYSFMLNNDLKEITGKLTSYDSGRATEYEFESDWFTDKKTEVYYDENWEEIQDEILDKFYEKKNKKNGKKN